MNPEWRINNVSGKAVGVSKLMLNAPIKKILMELKKGRFIKQNRFGKILPTAHTPVVNLTHYEIVKMYNAKIYGLLNFYNFASNRFSLAKVFWFLRASCALTLARKLKLKTMRQIFNRFGFSLKCSSTEIELSIPKSLKVTH